MPKAVQAWGLLVSDCVCMCQVQSQQACCYAEPCLRLSSSAGNSVHPGAACCCHCYRGRCAKLEWSGKLKERWTLLSLQMRVPFH